MSLKGEKQLQARMRAIGKTELVVRRVIIAGVGEAKRLVPHKTRNLSRTIRPGTITARSGQLVAGGTMRVGYAGFVERGTRPHVIRAKNRKALAWGGPRTLSGRLRVSGGVTASPTHFAKSVHHPGTKAQPYLVPGLRKAANDQGVKAIVSLWNEAA